MSVKKIFVILITVIACVMIGALVLNILMPNVTKALVNGVEGQIYSATGMSFDFNGDGVVGKQATKNLTNGMYTAGNKEGNGNNKVDGFKKN